MHFQVVSPLSFDVWLFVVPAQSAPQASAPHDGVLEGVLQGVSQARGRGVPMPYALHGTLRRAADGFGEVFKPCRRRGQAVGR